MNVSELLYGNHSRQNQLPLRGSGDNIQVPTHLFEMWVFCCLIFPPPFPTPLLFRNVFPHTLESGLKNPTGLQTHSEIRICHDTVWYPHLCTPTYLRLKSNPSQIPTSAFHTRFGYTEPQYQRNQTMMWLYQEHYVSWTAILKTAGQIWGISKSMYTPSCDMRWEHFWDG